MAKLSPIQRRPVAQTLVCTLGSSLLGNLRRCSTADRPDNPHAALRMALERGDEPSMARLLARVPLTDRTLGAEANSIASILRQGIATTGARIVLVNSDTTDGRLVARLLTGRLSEEGFQVESRTAEALDDREPRRFRAEGLPNLTRLLFDILREYGPAHTALNLTGGYKAQVAIALLVGQALGSRAVYQFETFPEVIEFPVLPLALDPDLWMAASGFLTLLEEAKTIERSDIELMELDWEERFEILIDRISVGDEELIAMSPVGKVLQEKYLDAGATPIELEFLPGPAPRRHPPRYEDAGWPGKHPRLVHLVERLMDKTPQVATIQSHYYNPALTCTPRAHVRLGNLELVLSDKGATAKFLLGTTAKTSAQKAAVVAHLNRNLRTLLGAPS